MIALYILLAHIALVAFALILLGIDENKDIIFNSRRWWKKEIKRRESFVLPKTAVEFNVFTGEVNNA